MSTSLPVQQTTSVPASGPPCTPAAPPSRSEIERKLSFRSATSPRIEQASPRKKRSPSNVSGNDSDTSLSSAQGHSGNIASSPMLSPSHSTTGPALALSPGAGGTAGPGTNPANRQLSAIAERLSRTGGATGEETEEYEEHDEGEDVSDEEEQEQVDQGERKGEGELQRGMEGERVLRSGYLYKKQEKRKVWKKKWFVLRTGKLAYYKDDREYSLSRVLDLRIIHTAAPVKVKKHSFTFGVVTKKRTFLVEASSQSEMDEWVAAINLARRRLTEEAAGSGVGGGGSRTGTATPMEHHDTAAAAVGTSPVINTSILNRAIGGASSSMTSSPAQIHPSSGLPGVISPGSAMSPTSNPNDPNQITGQLARMGVGSPPSSQPVGSGFLSRQGTASAQPIRSTSSVSRREPSASSLSSAGGADYFPRTPSAGQSPNPPHSALSPGAAGLAPQGQAHNIASDSDDFEAGGGGVEREEGATYFSDIASPKAPASQFGTSVGTTRSATLSLQSMGGGGTVDPSRVILSAYLMKRSKGRGRKVWRKRWFYLTSQGLTYTKSHMDTKTLRNIPLSSILDAIDQSSALDDIDPSSSDSDGPSRPTRSNSSAKLPSPPQRQLSALIHPSHQSGGSSSTHAHPPPAGGSSFTTATPPKEGEHTFRLVTAKRNYVLCAPSEEDEIKWLAAVKALLNRERGLSSPVTETAPRLYPASAGPGGAGMGMSRSPSGVPVITQQPPTPGSVSSATALAPAISVDQRQGQGPAQGVVEQQQNPPGIGLRGRSATYLAKSAVADVERRFHPEKQQAA